MLQKGSRSRQLFKVQGLRVPCRKMNPESCSGEQIFPRSHSERDIKFNSNKRGICQAQEESLCAELVPPDAGKNTTRETNRKLLQSVCAELFSSTAMGKGHWGAAHPRTARPPSRDSVSMAVRELKPIPGRQEPSLSYTFGAVPSRELCIGTDGHKALPRWGKPRADGVKAASWIQ